MRHWAQAHDAWADPIPDVPGALSWADCLRGQQHAMLWGNPTQKGRYWGIELPPRSALAIGLDTVSEWLLPVVDVPLLGPVARLVRSWARTAFLDEQKALADHLATIERILSGQGVRATPASASRMDYLLLRSASLGLPLDAEEVISGGGDWEQSDVAALEDLMLTDTGRTRADSAPRFPVDQLHLLMHDAGDSRGWSTVP